MLARIYGPYARQVTGWRLKFWFVVVRREHGARPTRYEVSITPRAAAMESRARPTYEKPRTHTSNFSVFAVPRELSTYPSAEFAFGSDRIADVARRLLSPEDLAAVTAMKLTGNYPDEAVKHYGGHAQSPDLFR